MKLAKSAHLENTSPRSRLGSAHSVGGGMRSDWGIKMKTNLKRSEALVESLDIDLDTLDSALMEWLTSDWQSLDEGEAHVSEEDTTPAPLPSPSRH